MGDVVKTVTSAQWEAVCEDYIAQNLVRGPGKPYSLADCAKAHGLNYDWVRQVAARDKWKRKLKARVEEVKQKAVEQITEAAVFDEREVRVRQATVAKLASSLAYKRLAALTEKEIKELSISECIALIKVGLVEERQALGLGDVYTANTNNGQSGDQMSDAQVFAVARRVIQMKQNSGVYSADEE
jgi:hypothetical protein